MSDFLTEEQIRNAVPEAGLFRDDITWLLSPKPFGLTKGRIKSLQNLGTMLGAFYDACCLIYNASADGKIDQWVSERLDAGKPSWLIDAQRSKALKQMTPSVIRPDLILMDDGWKITELDSVPGGQGVTAFLSKVYVDHGWDIVGGSDGIPNGFKEAHPSGADILVSRESEDYLAEMKYLSDRLGDGFSCASAETYAFGSDEKKSLYRFFELFDVDNVPASKNWIIAAAEGGVNISPPPVPHLEEKMWLALFHIPGLQHVWKKYLRGTYMDGLKKMIPHSWVVDPTPLPLQASLPWLNVNSWDDVASFSQKERQLVLKISGFNELAWGSRGVYIGHDMSAEDWSASLNKALSQFGSSPWMMQEFHSGLIVEHPYYDKVTGKLQTMEGRVRLCPYYYRSQQGKVILGGCLATIVPKEKKKIHGMSDGIMVPCSRI